MNSFARRTLCAALLCLGALPARAEGSCPPLNILASVDLIQQDNGTVFVPVTIGGRSYYFELETAAPLSSITPATMKDLGLTPSRIGARMINSRGDETSDVATLPSFELGGMRGSNLQFLVEAGDRQAASGSVVRAGGLGADFLRPYDIDLDFGAGKMNLISRDHCPGKVVYWNPSALAEIPMVVRNDNKISFVMTLDGHDLETVLNTGVAHTAINMRVAKQIYGIDDASPGNELAGEQLDEDTPLYLHRFQSLGVEGLAVGNPRILLLPDRIDEVIARNHPMRKVTLPATRDMPDLILGMSTLRHLHVYIDYHEQKVYVSAASGGVPAPSPSAP